MRARTVGAFIAGLAAVPVLAVVAATIDDLVSFGAASLRVKPRPVRCPFPSCEGRTPMCSSDAPCSTMMSVCGSAVRQVYETP